MAIAWFVCGYDIRPGGKVDTRHCSMDRFTAKIAADTGQWSEVEVLGGYALVKVRASESTLATIAGTKDFHRLLDKISPSDSLSDLTTTQRNALITRVEAMGYTLAEISAAFGSNLTAWRGHEFGDVLRLMAGRRVKSRWDTVQRVYVFDGPFIPCGKTIAILDTEVTE